MPANNSVNICVPTFKGRYDATKVGWKLRANINLLFVNKPLNEVPKANHISDRHKQTDRGNTYSLFRIIYAP